MNEKRLTKPRLVPAVFATFLLGLTALHTAPSIAEEQGAGQILIENEIKWMDRLSEWHSPAELLILATGNAGELLKLSGIRDPYPGELGVVTEGALADLLLVDGNPLEDVKVVGELENLRVIIKDGQVYKNTLYTTASIPPTPQHRRSLFTGRSSMPVPGDRETYEEYRDLWFGTKPFEELSEEVRKQLESMEEAEVNDYQRKLLEFTKEDVAYPQGPGGAPHPNNLIDEALAAGGRLKQGDAAQLLRKVFGSGDDL